MEVRTGSRAFGRFLAGNRFPLNLALYFPIRALRHNYATMAHKMFPPPSALPPLRLVYPVLPPRQRHRHPLILTHTAIYQSTNTRADSRTSTSRLYPLRVLTPSPRPRKSTFPSEVLPHSLQNQVQGLAIPQIYDSPPTLCQSKLHSGLQRRAFEALFVLRRRRSRWGEVDVAAVVGVGDARCRARTRSRAR
jgi:hypothetical protein